MSVSADAIAVQLHSLAAQALNAKNAGDTTLYSSLMSQYRTALGRLQPAQRASTQATFAADMPSDFLTELSGMADSLTNILKVGALLVAGYFAVKLAGRRRSMW